MSAEFKDQTHLYPFQFLFHFRILTFLQFLPLVVSLFVPLTLYLL